MKIIKLIGLSGVLLAGALFAQDPAQLGKISVSGDMKEVRFSVPIQKGDAATSPSKTTAAVLLDVLPAVLPVTGEEKLVTGMLVTKIKSEQYDKSVVRYTLSTSVPSEFTAAPEKGRIVYIIKPSIVKAAAIKPAVTKPVSAKPARQGQRNGTALPRQTLARTGSADGLIFKEDFWCGARIIPVQLPRIKVVPISSPASVCGRRAGKVESSQTGPKLSDYVFLRDSLLFQ